MSAAAGTGCFYAEVDEQIACTVHCCYLPCHRQGEPASPVPVHMSTDGFERDELLAHWRDTTGGQRVLILHRGSIGGTGGGHRLGHDGDCWCGPERVGPDPVIV